MASSSAPRVNVSGEIAAGTYLVRDKQPDGTLILEPDSAKDMLDRNGLEPATLGEFEAEHGPLPPPDDEG
jgi:hypothetical protein